MNSILNYSFIFHSIITRCNWGQYEQFNLKYPGNNKQKLLKFEDLQSDNQLYDPWGVRPRNSFASELM